jgi:hypothetical protein
MLCKKIKILFILICINGCGPSFIKSFTDSVYCFPEYIPNKKLGYCSYKDLHFKIHPYYKRIESTCGTSFINPRKRSQCEDAGYKYFSTKDIVYTPPLFLLERFFPEVILEKYKNSQYKYGIFYHKENIIVPRETFLQQLQEYSKERKNKQNSKCYNKFKTKLSLLLDKYEKKYLYQNEDTYKDIEENIKSIVYQVMSCSNDWK